MSSCEICSNLWQLFSDPKAEKKIIDLGTFDDALASPCPEHTRIIRDFEKQCNSSKLVAPLEASSTVEFLGGGPGRSTTLTAYCTKSPDRRWNLIAAKRDNVTDHPGVGRILDPDWMDLDIVNGWKRECLDSHGARCENPLRISRATPDWLIDVQKKCIMSGRDGRDYVALSYRSATDTAATYEHTELQQEGVLDRPEIVTKLPLKIKHAMSLTAALGERYLWADSLCFDASDSAATFRQLSLMTSIYTNALFTIIAADGGREDGINGMENISEPRVLKQRVFPLDQEKLIVRNTSSFSLEHSHEYHKRGWSKFSHPRLMSEGLKY